MGYVVVFNRLAFQRTKPDDASIPDGPEDVVSKGERVPDYVPPFTLDALSASGMITMVNDEPVLPPIAPEPEPEVPTGPVAPKTTDSRAAWEAYAEELGMPAEQAQGYPNKGELIDAVTALTA